MQSLLQKSCDLAGTEAKEYAWFSCRIDARAVYVVKMKGIKQMGILDKIKEESKKSGQSKGKFIYFRENEKKRIRFLTDMDEGLEIVFHDSFEKGVNVPCQEIFGKDCPYCEDEDLRTRSLFAWSVYDYDAKEVKILMQAVNNCTAVPALMALYETYGTLTDRDLVITKTGKQQNTTFSVVPMDKNKFRNEKIKALSEKAILKYLSQAYPVDGNDDDDDEDYSPKKYKKDSKKKGKSKDDDDEDLPWDDDEESTDYEDMSVKELYSLCKERDIECKPKKSEKYYINLLEEDDAAHDDWDDEDDDDDWDDDED